MAYIPDAELHEIFLQNLDAGKTLQDPDDLHQKTKTPKQVKYSEIFESFKRIENPRNSSFEEDIFFTASEEKV